MPTLKFKVTSKEQLDHVFRAEDELHKAGVEFDTGYDTREAVREWALDWSLKGAELVHEGKVISK
jgi:hypothetical protein